MTKRIQKFLAVSLAATLAFSTTVMAAPVVTSTGSAVIEGDGAAEYVDTNVYSVTLPTGKALSFQLDPQGLLALEDGQSATLESLSGNAGKIVGSTSACIINDSAKAIKVSVSMATTVKTAGDVTLKNSAEGISDNATKNNILICAIPAVSSISSPDAYQTASQGYILEQTPAVAPTLTSSNTDQLTFVLDAAKYEVSKNGATYTYKKAGDGNGTGIQIGGLANSKDDWKDFIGASPAKTVGMKAIFAFAPVDGTEVVKNEKAYGFVSAKQNDGSTDLKTIDVKGTTGPITLHLTKGATANTPVALGGTFKSLKLLSLGGVEKNSVLASGTHYSASGSKVTLLGSWTSKLTTTAVMEATITVDGSDTTQKITVYFD